MTLPVPIIILKVTLPLVSVTPFSLSYFYLLPLGNYINILGFLYEEAVL